MVESLSPAGRVLLVIPSYRDSARLGEELPRLIRAMEEAAQPVDLLVVDDGSGGEEAEETARLVEKHRATCRAEGPVQVWPALRLPQNLGKGGAVYAGWARAGAQHEWAGFVDADGATPAREVVRLLALARSREDLDGVIAARIQMLGRQVERQESRHFIGRLYATLANYATGLPVHDSQCGCKFFRLAVLQKVLPQLQELRFGFDMELLWELSQIGARLREEPIDWSDIPGSKVRVLRDGATMLASLARLRRKVRAAR